MERLRICIDQDEVLASLFPEWLNRYNTDFNDNLTEKMITEWDISKFVKPEAKTKIFEYLDDPELFENLPVVEDSQRVVEKLNRKYDVYICTAAVNPNTHLSKYKWLKKHFPFLDEDKFVFTVDKGIILAHWMIDDKPNNLEAFLPVAKKHSSKLLFDAPHNRSELRFKRMSNWKEIEQHFKLIE